MGETPFEDIESRQPIMDLESTEQYPPDKMDGQWRLLTEAIRRDILVNPETRRVAISYVSSPVDESLAKKFLDELSLFPRIGKLIERFRDGIVSYLGLETVPEDQIIPDIRHAPSLQKPHDIVKRLKELYGENTQDYYLALLEYVNRGTFLRGITAQERLMVAQRYRFARDVKLLALQAEVASLEGSITTDNSGNVVLPSRTCIRINVEDNTRRQELINPQNWQKRRQLKDRVYVIQVGSNKYILKEKKTPRHADTHRGGYKPGLTSLQELETANSFKERVFGSIKVCWEKPVASVIFPDGFQFTVFEHEDGLLEEDAVIQELANAIISCWPQFQAEYEVIKAMAGRLKDDPRVLDFQLGNTEFGFRAILNWLGLRKEKIPELSFEEFAVVKALRMKRQAISLLKEIIAENFYINRDQNGYSFKINLQNEKPQLEIFGFDFEYFLKLGEEEIKNITKQKQIVQEISRQGNNVGFLKWDDGKPVTIMQNAAYLAILVAEGVLPEK